MQKNETALSVKGKLLKKKWLLLGLSILCLFIILFSFFSDHWFGKSSKQSKIYLQYIDRADKALINDSLETALQLYFKALDIDNRSGEIYAKISESYYMAALRHKENNNQEMKTQMMSQSNYYFEQGKAKDPANPYFNYVAGLYLLERKQNDSALSEMAAATSKGIKSFYLHFYLSDLYNDKEETSLCLEQLNAAIDIKPNDTKVLYNLGELYFRIGNFSKALTYHSKLIETDPNNVEFKAIYAASLWKNGDERTGKKIFNQVLQDGNINQLQRHHIVSWILIDRDVDYEWGIKVANVTAETKGDVTSFEILGWGYYKIGDYKKSVQYLKMSYDKDPSVEVKRRLEMAQEKLRATGQQP